MRQLVAAAWIVLAATAIASANGRPPATSTINFRPGLESEIVAGMTFGVLISKDGGTTWHWACEDAVGYGGQYDPDYVYTASGALFATTFDGLKVNRDGCVYEPLPTFGTTFMSTATRGPDGVVYVAASSATDAKLYRSIDDGLTFPGSSHPGAYNDWWSSLEVAPSDPARLYLSGYRYVPYSKLARIACGLRATENTARAACKDGGSYKVFLLATSTDGGETWTNLPVEGFTMMPNSTLDIVGISRTDARTVFARVSLEDNSITDAIYRSTDGGESWTRILAKGDEISFLVRGNGELVAATETLGTVVSTTNGDAWTALVDPPHITCLAENSAGEVWACTQNYGVKGVPSDGFGMMKTTDLASWTGVLRFQDIQQPLACPSGTVQQATCDAMLWCGLCLYLGCDPRRPCPGFLADGVSDAGESMGPAPRGCCESSLGVQPSMLAVVVLVGILLCRRRRA